MPPTDPFLTEAGTLAAAAQARIESDKLITYSLDPEHEISRHKAIVFKRVLGYDRDNVGELLDVIAAGVETAKARRHSRDEHGTRFEVDIQVRGPSGRTAMVRNAWIWRAGERFPRLTYACVPRSRSHAKATIS